MTCCLPLLPKIVSYFPPVVSMTQECPSSVMLQYCRNSSANSKERQLSCSPLLGNLEVFYGLSVICCCRCRAQI